MVAYGYGFDNLKINLTPQSCQTQIEMFTCCQIVAYL